MPVLVLAGLDLKQSKCKAENADLNQLNPKYTPQNIRSLVKNKL
jgi:hypothetical protein